MSGFIRNRQKGFIPLQIKKISLKDRRFVTGFTIIEILIAVLIMVLVVGGAFSIYLMSITAWKEASTQIALQRKASIAMEKMVRGIDGRRGIREAQEITLPATGSSGTQIDFVDAEDPTLVRSFYFSSGLDGDGGTVADNQLIYIDESGSETAMIKSNLRTLTFNHISEDVVTIDLGLQDEVRRNFINVDLSTTVKMRN